MPFRKRREPPYLTVGTDVSAKYRGAFCEAKIKTAKRLVKAKVTFKSDLSTAEVHDENIKGPLKVGVVVEVKNQDGVYQEATINKLTDASIYTVVFDDGDEKTLRRSSLCLKGARHFAESETLDRLPLTNPEHFGTPVIGKKGNRGRRSNPVQEEELSSSSSEEEESDQRPNEDLFGKVVCVEGPSAGDKRKPTWYPALVISPDCHEDVTAKKDNVFVRSFKDGKFFFNSGLRGVITNAVCPTALDAALEFQQKQIVPGSWKTEVKEESSSSEEEDEDEEQEEDASGEEEEEVEPFPEERESFLQQLYKFMEDRGTPINKRPVLGYRNLNLFKLYRLVHKLGGFDSIESGAVWKQVYQDLGIPVLNSAAGYNVKCAYRKYLYGFEDYCTSTSITFKMDLPLKQSPKREVKTELSQELRKTTTEQQRLSDRLQAAGKKVQVHRTGDNLPGRVHKRTTDDKLKRWIIKWYDEWIKADKIVRPANKNVPKIKHRKKIKRLGDREVLGPPSNASRVPRSKCGLSQDVFSKTDEGEDKGTRQSPVKSIEITSILNGLQGSRLEERGAGPGGDRGDRGASSSSSSDDESAALPESQAGEVEQSRPKTKGSSSKKYNGMKEKTVRQGGFWEIPEKRAKVSGNAEERALVRPKGQKDVWSSIQAQWPKKTLKDLFSDSDTEATNSPPPPAPSRLDEPGVEEEAGPEDEASEEQMEKLQEFPSSGSNSVLNTPPTTPESPSGGGSAVEDSGQAQPSPPSLPPALPSEPVPDALPPGPAQQQQEEAAGGRSETDSSTVEVESLGGELQELPRDDGAGSPSKTFDVSLSCNSSSCSLELSGGCQLDGDPARVFSLTLIPSFRPAANSSDSEDQSAVEGAAKPAASKNHASDLKAAASSPPKCHGRSPPSSHKFHKQGDADHGHGRSPRVYKWSFQMSDLEKMSSLERISFLQEKLQDIRNHYLSLKSEVASIDRRRKRMKKKEREMAASSSSTSSSSSSSPSSSSLTAAVMLTLADPPVSSSSSSQNSGVSVECR
uniref:AT-rich interaction domain 4B n=1 Tax=Kryptolebias marmoratus TaxID=37003 RepID=A0A3Q3AEP9_KRYMA